MSRLLNQIMALGGMVELTAPLMIFIEKEDKPYDDVKKFNGDDELAIIQVAVGSVLKVLAKEGNSIYGEVVELEDPKGYYDEQMKVLKPFRPEIAKGRRFVGSAVELEAAIKC